MTKGRLEAFSDGVIAIIITITILIIDLPEGNDMAALMGVMPLAICYLISFILALILSFIPGAHYASCPLLVVAMVPWIVPDLRMKRVFEEARRMREE